MLAWNVTQNVLQDQHNNEVSGCVLAQIVMHHLAVSQAQVRIPTWHPKEVHQVGR
jgi:hypothetical protein